MKKTLAFILSAVLLLSLYGCKSTEAEETEEQSITQTLTEVSEETVSETELDPLTLTDFSGEEILAVYFDTGKNEDKFAEAVCKTLGCGSFEIVPAEAYPEDEGEKLARANNEYENLILPALVGSVENMASYKVLIVIFGDFDGNMPMAVRTFLEDYDLRRTATVPVCLYNGENSGFAEAQLKSLLSRSPVYEGIEVNADADFDTVIESFVAQELK